MIATWFSKTHQLLESDTNSMDNYTLKWNDQMHGIGIAKLDSQHREILNLVNQIASAVANGSMIGTTRSLVNDLVAISQIHFAYENELMLEYGYPYMQSHVENHDELMNQIQNLVEDIIGSKRERAELISAYLNDWVEKHIIKSDMALGKFLIAKGVS